MASPNLSELVTTTLRNRTGKLADNVTKNNALLMRLSEKGNVRPVDGGRTIVQELEYAENATFMFYSGYEALNISPSDVMTSAEFNWAQAAVAVTISGLEELQNSGKEKIIDLIGSRIKNAERTMTNNIAVSAYSDGTGYGGKQIGGLQLLVADDPTTGTVGGINRANWAFWRNQKFGGVADGGGAITTSNIQQYMQALYSRTLRGADAVDLVVADNNYYNLYWTSLQNQARYMPVESSLGKAGFQVLKFQNADVVLDGGIGGGCPANHMYFLNTNYIHFRPHTNRNFVPLDPVSRASVNQDAIVKLIGFAGNMTLSNASLQGVLVA